MGNAVKPQFSLDLSDQTALVTGTTSGLGRRFAQILAACGAKVALAGRRTERLDELANEIRESGGTVIPVMLDMTNRALSEDPFNRSNPSLVHQHSGQQRRHPRRPMGYQNRR